MKITLGTTYYNNPEEILKFIDTHLDFVDELIIVDDGSKIHPLKNYVEPSDKLKLYEVKDDLGFNSHGCRNLIMKESENDWVLLLDSDRFINNFKESIGLLKRKKLNPLCKYNFILHVERLSSKTHISVNDFLIHKDLFFSVGGYDEEYVGIRTGDREFFEQLKIFGTTKILYFIDLILTKRSTLTRSESLKHFEITKPHRVFKKIKHRLKVPEPNKPILQFKWSKL